VDAAEDLGQRDDAEKEPVVIGMVVEPGLDLGSQAGAGSIPKGCWCRAGIRSQRQGAEGILVAGELEIEATEGRLGKELGQTFAFGSFRFGLLPFFLFFEQGDGFAEGFIRAGEVAGLDALPDEGFLFGLEMDFHALESTSRSWFRMLQGLWGGEVAFSGAYQCHSGQI
jgi:hypothetical protein